MITENLPAGDVFGDIVTMVIVFSIMFTYPIQMMPVIINKLYIVLM